MLALLKRLAQKLDEADISYMIIGGQAVLVYGEPRLTRDIDITLGITPKNLTKVLKIINEVGLQVLVENAKDFVGRTWVLPTLDSKTKMRVDFIFSWSPYELQALKRAKAINIGGYPVRFVSPEDLIIHKILAGRPRDLEDVVSVLRKQKGIDFEYVKKWLTEFEKALNTNLLDIFEKIVKEENK